MFIGLTIGIFLFTVLVLYQVMLFLTRKERYLKERFDSILSNSWKIGAIRERISPIRRIRQFINILSFPGLAVRGRFREKLKSDLIKSGLPLKEEELIIIQLLSIMVFILFSLILSRNLLIALLFGVFGFFLPFLWIHLAKVQRVKNIEQHLLNSLVLLANSLRAGHSFLQALEIVSSDTPPPLADEFHKVLRDTKLGVPLEEALLSLSKRVESNDLEMVVTGVLIQRQVGGNLAEVLDSIAYTIDKRIKTKAKIKALTAQPKLSGWIISILPLALALFIFISKPDFIQTLITEPMGRIMLVGGSLMMVVGIFLIRKVVNIDV